MNARELLEQHGIAFQDTRKGSYTTACPNCNGGYLNVKIKSDGVVWFCHACEQGGGDWFEKRERESDLGPIKAIYDYRDENSNRLFQVLRFEPINGPKQFRQRTEPDQEKWRIKGVRRVLYRLPELLSDMREDHTVFVVEGEKDVETLRKHGAAATTNAMGATTEEKQANGGGWLPAYSDTLRGADVVLVCDNDAQGHDHVHIVAACLHGIAARIRVLDLAKVWRDIEVSDDISDWFERGGGTVAHLWQTVEQLPDWVPPSKDSNGKAKAPSAPPQPKIVASPFVWRDPATIPQRAWLYGHHYIRKYLTSTIAPGGGGKTSLAIGEALSMATGRPLLGITPTGRLRLWLWNGEDPADEGDRRIIAGMIKHGIEPADVDGFLFRDTGRETPIVLATQTRNGTVIAVPVIDALIETIKRNQIDVLIVDPFVKSHKVSENDNVAIDTVASEWAKIADITNCGIELSHHSRKTGGAEIAVEDSRGATALVNASRSVRIINKMSKDEAKNTGIKQRDAWRYFRVENGKANMAPPPEQADWYKLENVTLANGDHVGVATAWKWPDPFADLSPNDLRMAQAEVSQGGPWRANVQAKMWVGIPIAKALRLDAKKDRKRIAALLETWITNEMFTVVSGKGDDRHQTQFVEVGKWAD